VTSPTTTPRRGGPVVGALVLLWLLGLLALLWWLFRIGMEQWANSYSDPVPGAADLDRQASRALLATAVLAVAGAAAITLVAYRLGLVRTAVVFLVLTLVLAVPGLAVAASAYRDLTPAPPPPGPPGHCQEHSGGDTRCPGG
jgi:hypothetical protein